MVLPKKHLAMFCTFPLVLLHSNLLHACIFCYNLPREQFTSQHVTLLTFSLDPSPPPPRESSTNYNVIWTNVLPPPHKKTRWNCADIRPGYTSWRCRETKSTPYRNQMLHYWAYVVKLTVTSILPHCYSKRKCEKFNVCDLKDQLSSARKNKTRVLWCGGGSNQKGYMDSARPPPPSPQRLPKYHFDWWYDPSEKTCLYYKVFFVLYFFCTFTPKKKSSALLVFCTFFCTSAQFFHQHHYCFFCTSIFLL